MKGNSGRDLHSRPGQNGDVANRPGERGDLRQRMHRLLEQDVDRCSEHPMAELPCCHLPQRNVIDAAYEVWPAKGASGNQSLQPDEGRMMHEILVDAESCTVLFSGRQ